MSAAPTEPGLVHLGVRYESTDDLVTALAPYVRAALDGGLPVHAMVADDVAAALHAELGETTTRIRFEPESGLRGMSPGSFLGRLRSWCAGGARILVVGQYSVVRADVAECAHREDAVNVLLRDLPLTLLCASSPVDGPDRADIVRRCHTGWISPRAVNRNPDFRPPADRSRTPARMWGRTVLRTGFRGAADLALVRHRVIELVCELGIRGTAADVVVLAAHEAATLACRAGPDDTPDPGGPERSLELRVTSGAVFCEVRGPGPTGVDGHADAWTVPGATVSDTDRLRPLTWFCRRVSMEDDAGIRTIRVLVDRPRPTALRAGG